MKFRGTRRDADDLQIAYIDILHVIIKSGRQAISVWEKYPTWENWDVVVEVDESYRSVLRCINALAGLSYFEVDGELLFHCDSDQVILESNKHIYSASDGSPTDEAERVRHVEVYHEKLMQEGQETI